MFNSKTVTRIAVYSAIFYFGLAKPAYAYIDPGSGSYFLQLLIASLLAGLYSLKIYWAKIRSFLGKILKWRD
jgi:hypothetical protein